MRRNKKGGRTVRVALVNPTANPKKGKEKGEEKKTRRRRRKPSFQFLAKINPKLPDQMKKAYANPTEYTVKISRKRSRARRNPDIMKMLTNKDTLIGIGVGFASSRFVVPKIASNIPFIKDNPQYWSFLTPVAGGVVYAVGKGKVKKIGLGVAIGGLVDLIIQKITGNQTMAAMPPGGVSGLEYEPVTEAVFPPPPEYYEPLSPEEEAEIQGLAAEIGVSTDEELGFLRWLWKRARQGVRRAASTGIRIGKMAPAWTPVGAAARVGEKFMSPPPPADGERVSIGVAKPRLNLRSLKGMRLRGTINLQVV